ncbi:HD domain-containing phosphohydrolase [Achromobacter sp. SLBN-14]|uniref:HD domain-containing phosphohydrolase n=1 Tax=Achromobacter sp. SLBN-14 TaxID=2768442 RepID=UPI00116A0F09|nr:HD domain-containing phosphohydrolase [Achromobacter sp. SLBN-14]TQJ94691.1 response regulator RpfG family c-di-GMP phosphodiesterase [Achromobacter sp. SLBN-14]
MSDMTNMEIAQSPTLEGGILLVDDEPNILSSLLRELRGAHSSILTATDGVEAINKMVRNKIDLIICDANMPGMSGADLLSTVQQRWPDTVRILLTGYPEHNNTIRAINEGRIYRYLTKPWDADQLRIAVSQGLALHQAQSERKRLEQINRQQYHALQHLNNSLERRVKERTIQLERANAEIEKAHQSLQQSYVTATRVFASLINLRLPSEKQSNAKVASLVSAFCDKMQMNEKQRQDLTIASALYNIGKLTWDDTLITESPDRMERAQRDRYRTYPVVGESLLMSLEPATDAANIIRHHQERWDGAGFPDGLAGDAIPYGARVLKIATDYVELRMGVLLSRKFGQEEAIEAVRKYSGRLYDPSLCVPYIEVMGSIENSDAADEAVLVLDTARLEPGMILVKDLHALSGMLLISAGKALTERLIDKLVVFEQNEDATYQLFVRIPEAED